MVLAILQARCSSTRLPGKVLKEILGQPMLTRQLERLKRSERIDKLIVATSDQPDDNPLARLCEDQDISCYRGSLDNVLDRFYQAARPYQAEHIVRLTGDCPLTDPQLIDQIIDFYFDQAGDYASNSIRPTFPDGLDAEVLAMAALETAWREASLTSEKEHVTPFITNRPGRFNLANFESPIDFSKLRWTVDEPEDLSFVRAVYERLYHENPAFNMADILALVESCPDLGRINENFVRNEGLAKSLAEDKVDQ